MTTPGHVVRFLMRNLARWEPNGEWDGSRWSLRDSSDGLTSWLSRQEWENPDVWRVAAKAGQRITIQGQHFDYRLTSLGAGLMMERRRRRFARDNHRLVWGG